MTDIATNLNTIDGSLSDIKTAIVNKGVTPSGNITTFATAISGITPLNGETVNITPSTSPQTITPTSPANGITQANVSAVTSSIDANIQAGNIKDGVTILGVTGIYTGSGGGGNNDPTVKANYILRSSDGINYTIESIKKDNNNILNPKADEISTESFLWGAYGSNNSDIREVSFSSLEILSNNRILVYSFLECANLTNVDFSSLQTISGGYVFSQTFNTCTSLTSVSFPVLSLINGDNIFEFAFANCTSLVSVSFPALTSQSFGSYTSQFHQMLLNTSGVTVHFPSNLQAVIGSWTSVTAGFGGTNTTVLFDLPATS